MRIGLAFWSKSVTPSQGWIDRHSQPNKHSPLFLFLRSSTIELTVDVVRSLSSCTSKINKNLVSSSAEGFISIGIAAFLGESLKLEIRGNN